MKALHGVISDRLRKLFTATDKAWTPPRGTEPHRPVPGHVEGHRMGGRGRHRK